MNLYEILKKLDISYEEVEHARVFTVEEAEFVKKLIKGTGIKNIFLTNHKGSFYLVLIEDRKQLNIKEITNLVNEKHLSFASVLDLEKILKLEKGSVTPLGLINDIEHQVIVLIDKDLVGNKVLVHPNTNDKTMALDFEDLLKLIHYLGNKYLYF